MIPFYSKYKNYILTFFTEFTVLLAGILVYKFANQFGISENSFAEYALSRRTISFIQPVLILGMGVGIPRYIAMANGRGDKPGSDTYYLAGVFIVMLITLLCSGLMLIFNNQFAFLLFGSEEYNYLIFPSVLMIPGLVFHTTAYTYFRGNMQMGYANVLQLLNLGIVPVIAFLVSHNIISVLYYTGIGWLIVALLFMFIILLRIRPKFSQLKKQGREIFIYGVQRFPGDVIIALLFGIPAFAVAHISGIETAGYMAFGISLLNMAGAAFGPICLILLPEASKMVVEKNFSGLKSYASKATKWTLGLTLFGVLIFEAFAKPILQIYLGEIQPDLILICQLVLIGSVGYTLYISLRSILDAYYVKAVNTINILYSFILFSISSAIIYLFVPNYFSVLIGFILSMLLLGFLTHVEINKIFKKGTI